MDDLIKQMRDCANGVGSFKNHLGDFGLCDTVADRLAELEAENASLKAQLATVEAETLERAAKVCLEQQEIFLSPDYATNQPMSSFHERFACGCCVKEIRALKNKDTDHEAG